MLQQINFTAKEKDTTITETFEIDTNDPTRVQVLNHFIHLELFFNKLFYPAEEVHHTYLYMLDAYGILDKYNKKKIKKSIKTNNIILKDFEIDTHAKFMNKLKNDEGFSHFIYDFLKESL